MGSPSEDGMWAGIEYAEGLGLQVNREKVTEQLTALDQVLSSWTGDRTDRFVHLLAHNFAVAAAARIAYQESALSEYELRSYLDTAVNFFNSWRHR